ncbi:FAD dependent oxidoreductase [Halobacillus dabanensis]|uniref:FAD dependent oxidoreductase n=1 Tax=Halobacillus dabanensis TaxID=240302 RepID=A0A1I3RXR0_HALDA|nr:FAD-dependent oxidoreductase [Halobacillus dabanensis]SFJ51205.1 FAD dependent oxidoreductase [Halobacillus dabanensis]
MVQQKSEIYLSSKSLPILYDVDAVIIGGTFAGVTAARRFAEAGKKVALVESRTYLGTDMCATLRPWVQTRDIGNLSKWTKGLFEKAADSAGETGLYLDQVKRHLEDLLVEENVSVLYASQPIDLIQTYGKRQLIIGNKSGRQIIQADVVIGAESSGLLREFMEGGEESDTGPAVYRKTIEMYRAEGSTAVEISVPKSLGIHNNTVHLHRGYLNDSHVFLEFELVFPYDRTSLAIDNAMEKEIASRHIAMDLASYLIQSHPAFKRAYLAGSSYELHSLSVAKRKCESWRSGGQKFLENRVLGVPLNDFVTYDLDIWYLNEFSAPGLFESPVAACKTGEAFASELVAVWDELLTPCTPSVEPNREPFSYDIHIGEGGSPREGREYPTCEVPGKAVPVLQETDVLVVGGGTSGANAAITAAKEGVETVLLDMNPGLGGTATYGAVDSYWFGRKGGFNVRISEWLQEVHDRINHKSTKWNIEAKMYTLLNEAEKAGVKTYLYATTIGTIMDGTQVKGVVVATKWGVFAIKAKVVIDATGDGDIAAFAGAEHVYGSETDQIVMWYSLAQFAKPGKSQNNFTSMVKVSDIEDYTRAIMEGRRRKRNRDCHDHGIYVASRETRHIFGEVVLTLTDQLKHRQWEDVVNIHFSNHDMKGKSGSSWMNIGLIPPNLEIEVPYRALLPKNLTGILVVGKAISATHDGFAAIRMQADLENLGGVAALAAVQAVRNDCLPHEIDRKHLQSRLVVEDVLPEGVTDRSIEEKTYTDEELERLVGELNGEMPLYSYADMEMDDVYKERIPFVEVCTAGPRVLPYLQRALNQAVEKGEINRQVLLAKALAMYGSKDAVPVLIKEIEKELSGGVLPKRSSFIRHTQLPPDQGAMPDVVYLMYALALTKDERSIAVWRKVAEWVEPSEGNLKDMYKGTFYYIDALCDGAERLARPECIPVLESLHRHETIRNQMRTRALEPDYFKERQAMLELAIGRALAVCGSSQGLHILIDYLSDYRSLLADQAHTYLRRLTGEDFGKHVPEWKSYVEVNHQYDISNTRGGLLWKRRLST